MTTSSETAKGQDAASESAAIRILTTARHLFAQHGFKGTTTRAIAKEASVNEVTVFRIWKSKEALLEEVIAKSLPSEANAPLARLLDREASSLAELEALLSAFMEAFYCGILPSISDLLQIALKEGNEHPEYLGLFGSRFSRLVDLLADRLASLDAALIRRERARPVAEAILEMLIGRYLMSSSKPSPPLPDFKALAEVYVNGISGGQASWAMEPVS
jgi:AcrR family transcriptional regulator